MLQGVRGWELDQCNPGRESSDHVTKEARLLDPDEGNVTNPGDMALFSRLKQCAEASTSFTWWKACWDILLSSRPLAREVRFEKSNRC